MKIYTIHLNNFAKKAVLTALYNAAITCDAQHKQASDNYMQVYGDILEELQNQ